MAKRLTKPEVPILLCRAEYKYGREQLPKLRVTVRVQVRWGGRTRKDSRRLG